MADAVIGNTEFGATKQDLIAAMVQRELAFAAKLVPTITDVSAYAVKGAKSISFPKLTGFTVVNRAEGVQGDATTLVATTDQMLLNFNAYVAWVLDATTAVQSNIQGQVELAKRAASAHGRYVDAQIIAMFAAAAASFQNVGTDVDVTFANLLNMQKQYMDAQGNPDQGTWIVSTQQNAVLLGLAQFSNYQGFGQMTVMEGKINQILGMPVMVHSGLASKQLFLVGKDGAAIGFQKAPSMSEEMRNEYGVGAVRAAMDQLFGVKALQTAQAGAASGKSPLILGLND